MQSYDGDYLISLRKSRSDIEAEARGEGETLARHEKALLELAGRMKLNIVGIYREVVSGETIAARPEMQRLLSEVEAGIWAGVLVMEVERLARGDTIDQGIVAQAFKFSGTKIITPSKTYDPENEFDEEYFEFGLFMSRREYKTINRRLQRGRLASVKEGKYIATYAPYGYEKVRIKNDKGFTLKPVENYAAVVRLIFELYVNGETAADGSVHALGSHTIAVRLDEMGISPPTGSAPWSDTTIRRILANPVYIGKILWKKHKTVKKVENGVVKESKVLAEKDEQVLVDGLHEAIVPVELFDKAHLIPSLGRTGFLNAAEIHMAVFVQHLAADELEALAFPPSDGKGQIARDILPKVQHLPRQHIAHSLLQEEAKRTGIGAPAVVVVVADKLYLVHHRHLVAQFLELVVDQRGQHRIPGASLGVGNHGAVFPGNFEKRSPEGYGNGRAVIGDDDIKGLWGFHSAFLLKKAP